MMVLLGKDLDAALADVGFIVHNQDSLLFSAHERRPLSGGA